MPSDQNGREDELVSIQDETLEDGRSHFLNITTHPSGTELWTYPPGAKRLGLVVGLPQTCRKSRPGGSSRYGSPEWFKEISFVDTVDLAVLERARTWIPDRLGNDPGSVGCAHVSMGATVTKIVPGAGSFTEQPYPAGTTAVFYSLAIGPDQDPTKPFVALAIWISDKDWPADLQEFIDATRRSKLVVSPCSP